MLSQTAKQEILRKINLKVGFQVSEKDTTPATRLAITNLATIQRHLFVITEILRGEKGRIEGSFILRVASKVGKDSERAEKDQLVSEIAKLQVDIDNKISDIAGQVIAEENARHAGTAPPVYKGQVEAVELKCPSCGATLPMPTGSLVQCQYCKATVSIQDVSSQLKSIIKGI